LTHTFAVYSSLQKIDIATDQAPPHYYQTDHRSREEIDAQPEISVLFALARILNARAYGTAKKIDATVVYVAFADALPSYLLDAIASAKGIVENAADKTRLPERPVTASPAESRRGSP